MLPALIAAAVIAVVVTVWLIWRSSRRPEPRHEPAARTEAGVRPVFPEEGILVPPGVIGAAGAPPATVWEALESAAMPVAVEYRPVTESDIARYRAVPVNASAQQAVINIVEALNPKSPTLYKVVLPKGAELVKAAGTSGYRGFSRTGGKTAHAVLTPVAAGGAVAVGWPVLAVAGTVMAVDMAARREQVAHQLRIETILGRQEERHYTERLKDQRSADAQLSRAISLMLDGHNPSMELALKSADDEFHRSRQFLESNRGVVGRLIDAHGKVDYRQLEEALGGKTKDVDHFVRNLHLSRAAIAIKRKALIADAASVALLDPDNPYRALQKHLDSEARLLEQTNADAEELTRQLSEIELKGRWRDREKSLAERQDRLRAQIAPATVDDSSELLYLSTSDGEIFQLIPSEVQGTSPEDEREDEIAIADEELGTTDETVNDTGHVSLPAPLRTDPTGGPQ
jgi:hypothetical protein